jgi:hypothetical protein
MTIVVVYPSTDYSFLTTTQFMMEILQDPDYNFPYMYATPYNPGFNF